ncbi:MAG: Dipeptide transport system permease protein DppC [Verrucomicrobiales bacterium]|nr:Dipeptide transport system permease protein DppC [Verrucomicrobiales bacterium]
MSDRVENSTDQAAQILDGGPVIGSPAVAKEEHLSPNQRAWRRFKRNYPAMLSLYFLAALVLLVLFWPWLAHYKPDAVSEAQFQAPSPSHWFGTDVHGRDLLTRVFYGASVSLLVGIVGAGVAFVIGVTWGAIAGYVGGRWDNMLMRFVDILYSLPSIVFVIVLITTLDEGVRKWLGNTFGAQASNKANLIFLFVGLGAVSWLTMARIVRGQVLVLRNRQFVDASRSLGASHFQILWHHILPNVYGIIIVYLTLTVPAIILYESFLSYLGLGIQPPMASWGSLIAEGAQQLNPIRIYWWLLVFPASMLVFTLLAMNFVGDGLRDAFDPRSKS